MPTLDDPITLTFPRSAVADIELLSSTLVDRLHFLLERNTDGLLSSIEQEELSTLSQMAQFSQIVSLAMREKVPV